MFGVDSVEIDDSYFQTVFSVREKQFLNIQSATENTGRIRHFEDQNLQNRPAYVFVMQMNQNAVRYERSCAFG